MSIIYEALKKVQTQFSAPFKAQKRNNPWLWASVGFVFLGFLGCGFVLMLLINSFTSKTVIKYVSPKKADTLESQETPNPPPIPKQNSPDALFLNGIMTMEGEYMALINNKIVKEGDYIQNLRVLSITQDKVELYSQGKIVVLSTK